MKSPLAFRVRPEKLEDIIGHEEIVGPNSFLSRSVRTNSLFSFILFGSPGTGKTTIAAAYAKSMDVHFVLANAVTTSKKELESITNEAKLFTPTILILDEIHRLDKIKQDYLLPFVEEGIIFLIGTTTSNPYISLSRAIRSRCKIIEVKPLPISDIVKGLQNAAISEKGLQNAVIFDEKALIRIAKLSRGDMRFALNILEIAYVSFLDKKEITKEDILSINNVPNLESDKDEEEHYDSVSALQKSIRGQDVDAALYYLARLLQANDLESIARRLLVIAYEDIGLANPNAVFRAQLAIDAALKVGLPEAAIPLGDAVIDLALSPHSRIGADSIESTMAFSENNRFEVKDYLKLTPVSLKEEDKYPYDRPDLWPKIQYLPDSYKDKQFIKYDPNKLSTYEKSLINNYLILKQIKKSSNLAKLKKEGK
ncbi:MAG: AAA family ATPase [Bacilli bacterium]|nr:AAA family ATPase [Bacilli bacterium]MDY6430542.1 AAA family ATPase [Bacilli bacterium]